MILRPLHEDLGVARGRPCRPGEDRRRGCRPGDAETLLVQALQFWQIGHGMATSVAASASVGDADVIDGDIDVE